MKYRKKPVVIDAIQWDGDNFNEVVYNFVGIICGQNDGNQLAIRTLGGTMMANPGDWIIRGVKGGFYPVRKDIFEMTYEKVSDEL